MHVKLRQSKRLAGGIGIVLVVVSFSLGSQLRSPGGEGQETILEARPDVKELSYGRITR